MQVYRSTFGQTYCEVFLHQSGRDPGGISAWALGVRSDGRLDPLVGGDGRFVQVRADTFSDALAVMKRRLVALLGDEHIGPDTILLNPGP